MGLLKKNIAFFAIDLIPLMAEQPALCKELLAELTALLTGGALPPLLYSEFPIAQAEQAFAPWRRQSTSAKSSSWSQRLRTGSPCRSHRTPGVRFGATAPISSPAGWAG